jgi:hypothetical protein
MSVCASGRFLDKRLKGRSVWTAAQRLRLGILEAAR